ncbi:sigma-70 family RNA polymerase sigma factor [Cereibacter sphaeroides]|nr:sigma-70 family RNA polymerase sigma factor [Cereibacter sphaeroides]
MDRSPLKGRKVTGRPAGAAGETQEGVLLRSIRDAEFLDAETERRLARAWRDHGDIDARNRIVAAHMKLALSHAARHRRHGIPMAELLQEASIGLMKAAEKFDPELGWRFSTYALWWVRVAIQDHLIQNKSLVRLANTTLQRKLFFALARVRDQVEREMLARGDSTDPHLVRAETARRLGVTMADIDACEGRLIASDASLNIRHDSADGEGSEWQDRVEDEAPGPEETVIRRMNAARREEILRTGLGSLSDRERLVIERRYLAEDKPATLEVLGEALGITKEGVRQIEVRAMTKMRRAIERSGLRPEFLAEPA